MILGGFKDGLAFVLKLFAIYNGGNMKSLLLAFVIVSVVRANLYAMDLGATGSSENTLRRSASIGFIKCGTPSPKEKFKFPKSKRDK